MGTSFARGIRNSRTQVLWEEALKGEGMCGGLYGVDATLSGCPKRQESPLNVFKQEFDNQPSMMPTSGAVFTWHVEGR